MDDTIEVRSMCINCEKEGINKIVKIEIPYFKNVLIHSFECEFCNYRNNVIQDLNTIKEKGIKILFKITKDEHLDRQLIKSEYGTFKIPEIDFEIPKDTQKGTINTIEGFIQTALSNLTEYLKYLKDMYNEVNGIAEGVTLEGKGNPLEDGQIGQIEQNDQIGKQKCEAERFRGKSNEQIPNEQDAKKNSDEHKNGCPSTPNEGCLQLTVENYIKMIEGTVNKLSKFIIQKELPFTVEIVDPSGLSSLEYYDEDIYSDIVTIEHYERCKKELNEMGFYEEDFEDKKVDNNRETSLNINETKSNNDCVEMVKKENFDFIKKYVHMNNDTNDTKYTSVKYNHIGEEEGEKLIESFTSNCPCCNYLGSNNFCEISIPGFKKCLILSYVCANCNFKTSEIKSSGEINPKGKKIKLIVKNKNDLNRFVIKSETASIHIPIIDLTSDYGTLGGSLTTVEGLILKIIESLKDKFKFLLGDSIIHVQRSENEYGGSTGVANDGANEVTNGGSHGIIAGATIQTNNDDCMADKIKSLISSLYKLCRSEELCPYEFIIDDIASNSYISSDKIGEDSNLEEEEYERTYEQNDMLGLTSMVTENY
ncbi:zinc finger protein, putative [Plasmodium ovale]|nr:zinc finger protein, putative [Plasmodium ovale]